MAAKFLPKLLALLPLMVALPIYAQIPRADPMSPVGMVAEPTSSEMPGSLELTTGAQRLSNGYGDWRDTTLRGIYKSGASVWQGELAAKRQFDQSGTFIGLSNTYTIDPDWFSMVAVGAGDGAFYLPRYRGDAFLYRKWLEQRNLVTSFGAGYYRAPDGHTDKSVSLGAIYYFPQPWIIEAGVRFNFSDPGAVRSNQQFLAVTYGTVGQDIVTARHSWGSEGYQAIAADVALVNFDSRQTSVSWRHWVTGSLGFLVAAEQYTNPSYRRQGISVGVFKQF